MTSIPVCCCHQQNAEPQSQKHCKSFYLNFSQAIYKIKYYFARHINPTSLPRNAVEYLPNEVIEGKKTFVCTPAYLPCRP